MTPLLIAFAIAGLLFAPMFFDRQNKGGLFSKWYGGNLILYPGDSGYGNEWFADSVGGTAGGDGKTWAGAVNTMTLAIALASAGDTIYCRGSFSEAAAAAVAGLRIIGCGTMPKETQWTSAADTISLTLSANYIEVANIYFKPPAYSAGTPAAIQLGSANHAFIHDCRFQGQTASHNAIYSPVCNSDNVRIWDCDFYHINTATYGAAILGVEAGGATYSAWDIRRCIFSGCVIGINIGGRVCQIIDNAFMQYGTPAAGGEAAAVCTAPLNLSGAQTGGNCVRGNIMQGDYSNTGGYTAGTNGDCWMGNYATDTAETEVDTTGLTIAVPAA